MFCAKRRINIIIILAFITILIRVAPVIYAQSDKTSEEQKLVRAIEKVKTCVVKIDTTTTDGGTGSGSGVILKQNGYIITNNHIMKNADKITITIYNGKKYHAVIAGRSPRNDLAVLKINATGLPVPQWGDSRKLAVGQTAIAIGNPFRFEGSVSRGIISAVNRRIPAEGILYKDLIQTDAAINPGNSGGALMDSRGTVIGINALVFTGEVEGYSAQGIGFAIPIHRALDVARQLMGRTVYIDPQPWIGVQGINITREMAEMNLLPVYMGVIVTSISPVSPAERAGLQKGDIVTQVDEKLIKNIDDFKQILSQKKPGDDMVLKIWRDERMLTISLKVSQRSVAP